MSAEKKNMAPAATKPDDAVPPTDVDPVAAAAEAEMMSAMGFSAFGAAPRAHGPRRSRGSARPVPTPARPHGNAQGNEFMGGVYMGQGVVGGNPPGWAGEAKKKRKIKHKGFQPEKVGAGTGANASVLRKNDKMAGLGGGGANDAGLNAGNGDGRAAAGTALDGTALSRIKPGSKDLKVAGATGGSSERQGDSNSERLDDAKVAFAGTSSSAETASSKTTSAGTNFSATISTTAAFEDKGREQKLEGIGTSSDSIGDINKMTKRTGTTFWSKHDVRSELMLPPPHHTALTSTLSSTAGAMYTNKPENLAPHDEDEMDITYSSDEHAKLSATKKVRFQPVGQRGRSQATKALNPAARSFNNETADINQCIRNMSKLPDPSALFSYPIEPALSSAIATNTQVSSPLSPPHDLGTFYAPSNVGSAGTHGSYGTSGTRSSYASTPASIAPSQDNIAAGLPAKPPSKKIKVGVLEMTKEELEAYNNGVKNVDGSTTYFRPSFIEDPWAGIKSMPYPPRS